MGPHTQQSSPLQFPDETEPEIKSRVTPLNPTENTLQSALQTPNIFISDQIRAKPLHILDIIDFIATNV